jgi:hypothetical protein
MARSNVERFTNLENVNLISLPSKFTVSFAGRVSVISGGVRSGGPPCGGTGVAHEPRRVKAITETNNNCSLIYTYLFSLILIARNILRLF